MEGAQTETPEDLSELQKGSEQEVAHSGKHWEEYNAHKPRSTHWLELCWSALALADAISASRHGLREWCDGGEQTTLHEGKETAARMTGTLFLVTRGSRDEEVSGRVDLAANITGTLFGGIYFLLRWAGVIR